MDTNSLFSNGLPEELEKLQSGQMYIFTSPYEGVTEKYIRVCQYIASLCKQNKIKEGQKPAVFVQQSENPELWAHIFCLVETAQGTILEIADVGSLTEMVYDFLGLDYDSMPKPVVGERYQAYGISIAEHHPIRVHLVTNPTTLPKDDADNDEAVSPYSASMSLDFICAVGKEPTAGKISKKIEELLWQADSYNLNVDIQEILKNFEEGRKKDYRLELDIEKRANWSESPTFIKKCDIYLVDEKGEKQIVNLEPQQKSVYLTFMLYDGGKGIKLGVLDNPKKNQDFKNLLEKIHHKMVGKHEVKGGVNAEMIGQIRSRIRSIINTICLNLNIGRNFLIEGVKGGEFRIAATTPELRKEIMDKFELE